MNKLIASDAATSLVLKPWTSEVAVERHCAAPVATVQGTGLPFGTYTGGPADRMVDGTGLSFAGICTPLGVLGTDGAGADQVQVRIPVAMNGIPPRGTPPRC